MEKPRLSLPDLAGELLPWYDAHRRDLPWRQDPSPYRVWVSEIMLQQTRVEAVKPYFARFLGALPDVYALGACPADTLAKLWQGLGYYSRARNLQRAAQLILRDHDGVIPSDPEVLLTLPGIGSYTAGAIASFAYGVPAPAVDGNVLRVLSRLLADERNILDPHVKRDYERAVSAAIPRDRAGDYNQALIEIGATVCGPNTAPDCAACPLAAHCLAHKTDLTSRIPVREKKKERRVEEKTVLLIEAENAVLLRRRPETGLLAGLYEFPMLPGHADEDAVRDALAAMGFFPEAILPAGEAKHLFTHIEWRMTGYRVLLPALPFPEDAGIAGSPLRVMPTGEYRFVGIPSLFDTYAIPSALARYRDLFKTAYRPDLLRSLPFVSRLDLHALIPSTQDRAKRLAPDADDFTVVLSDAQCAGYGRFGRAFFSPPGDGIFLSVILKRKIPAPDAPLLTPLAAVAVAEAIEECLPDLPVGIKWVNDLVIGDRKIAGILTGGAVSEEGDLLYAVIGIGLNVTTGAFPDDLTGIAASLSDFTKTPPRRDALVRAILSRLAAYLDAPKEAFLPSYRARSTLVGKAVTVTRGDEMFDATVTGIGERGELLLDRAGVTVSLSSGEVTRVRPQ